AEGVEAERLAARLEHLLGVGADGGVERVAPARIARSVSAVSVPAAGGERHRGHERQRQYLFPACGHRPLRAAAQATRRPAVRTASPVAAVGVATASRAAGASSTA